MTSENIEKAERALIECVGFDKSEYELKRVIVDKEEGHHMSTIVINTQKVSKLTQIRLEKAGHKNTGLSKNPPEKPTLVLVHGYGGTGTEFYYLFPLLSLNFRIVVFDLIGCGSSSRPKWNAKNGTEADEYYMRIIENWRKEMDLTDFILVAHSYGGYLMGTYASLYP